MDLNYTTQLILPSITVQNIEFDAFISKEILKSEEEEDCLKLFSFLKHNFGESAYDRFLKHVKYIGIKKDKEAIVLQVPSDFIRTVILQSYFREIAAFVYKNCTLAQKIEVIVTKTLISNKHKIDNEAKELEVKTVSNYIPDKNITFDNFVLGQANKIAYWSAKEASNMIAQRDTSINPCLCIFGPVGMGKTHLIKSIVLHVKNIDPKYKIEYIAAEEFKELYITAVRHNDLFNFKKRFADIDALVIDDVQFICSGSGSLEKEFSRLLNYLIDNRRWIIIACDRPPSTLKIDIRTKSRISSGLKASIEQSDFDLRLLILKKKINNMACSMPISILEYIATNVISSIRELEAILNNIVNHIKVMKVIDFPDNIVHEIIGRCDFISDNIQIKKSDAIEAYDVNVLINHVCKYYSIKQDHLMGVSRVQKISKIRAILIYIARDKLNMTLKQIGNLLGRNHTTILYLYNIVSCDKYMQDDANKIFKQIDK